MALYGIWENFLATVEPYLPEYLHWNEICWTFVYYLAEVRLWIHRRTRGMEHWEIVTNTALYCLYLFITLEVLRWLYSWLFCQDEGIVKRSKKFFFKVLRSIPGIKGKINEEMDKALDELARTAFPLKEGHHYIRKLPEKGLTRDELNEAIDKLQGMSTYSWESGSVSGTVYHGGKELTEILTDVYGKFAWTNPLHPDLFPGVRKMEAEVVQMCVSMFNGDDNCCGTMTSGGTESILMACKAYRDRGYDNGIKKPEIICPVTAHAAFDKACHYFRIKLVHVPIDEKTRKCDVKAMRRAITRNTVLLVGSAPSFPHGIVDPIEDIAKLAVKYKIGLHVDSCLGGFLLPFMKKAGLNPPRYDFTIPGVTSISADTHKYGFSPKGSSVILYHHKDLRKYQYFLSSDWSGGIYLSPAISGSRAGSIIAATWAALMFNGEQGYVEATSKIIRARQVIERGLRKINGIFVYGEPEVSVVAIGSNDFDIYRLSTCLVDLGYSLNVLQYPASIHLCVTMLHTKRGVAEKFIKDVHDSVVELMKNPTETTTGVGAVYGMAQSIPDRSMVNDIASSFLDAFYSTKEVTVKQNGSI